MTPYADPYRSTGDRAPPVVIDYRLKALWVAPLAFLVLTAINGCESWLAPSMFPVGSAIMELASVILVARIAHSARLLRVVIDRADARVTVRRSRFPLSPAERYFALPDVAGAEVTESQGRRGKVYVLVLVLRNRRLVPLTGGAADLSALTRVTDRITEAMSASRVS